MKAELDIKSFLKAINEFGIAEQQPCGVQVVERVAQVHLLVGKLPYYFLTRLLRVAQKPFFSTS